MDLPAAALLRVADRRGRPVGVAFAVATADGPRVITAAHVLVDGATVTTVDGRERVHVALGDDRVVTWRDNQERVLVWRLDGTLVADVVVRPPATAPVGDLRDDVPPSWAFRPTADPGTLVAHNTDNGEVHLVAIRDPSATSCG